MSHQVANQRVASDLQGDVVVVWDRSHGTGVYGRAISRSGTIGSQVGLGKGRVTDVALDDDGDGVVVWQDNSGLAPVVRSRRITRSGTFMASTVVGPGGEMPAVDIRPTGRVVVAWERMGRVHRVVQLAAGP